MSPKVTVVVSIYNKENYINACLNSLEHQTYNDFEVLLVDDASEDRSLEICKEYVLKDSRFRIISFEKNMGIHYSRALSLKEAKGEYVAVLDADDISFPNRLCNQVSFLDRKRDYVLVGSYYQVIDNSGANMYMEYAPTEDIELRWLITFGNCLGHSTVMFRKIEAIQCGGYSPNVLYGEDMEFYSRLMTLGKIGVIPETLSAWRSHGANLTYHYLLENQQYLIVAVKNSILRHTGYDVPLEVAAAVFNNSGSMAVSPEVFVVAVKLTVFTFLKYLGIVTDELDKKRLIKKAIDQLVNLFNRNRQAVWWFQVSDEWAKAVINVIQYI